MADLPAEGELLAGKYRLERIIGRGGMGVVFAAWHLELDHHVALKFLLPEVAERGDAAERFRREARAAAKIKSEHVARVLDVGNFDGGIPYMVMELLEGRDMGDELRKRGALPVQEAVDYIIEAIEAVAEAHSLGIVHRDLKPENLFLARRTDGSCIVKVLDFGISKTMVLSSDEERSLTQTSTIMGSPLYMSPEQMRAPRDVDGRSDVWALGAILYELLSGRPPFVADSIPQLCAMLVESTPAPLGELRPDLPEGLDRVVARCLAKPVAQRWPTVGDLARALLPYGSPASHMQAARAGRIHSATEALGTIGHGTLASPSPRASIPPPVRATPGPGATPSAVVASLADGSLPDDRVVHPTHQSWGQTRAPRSDVNKWSWITASGAIAIALTVVVWALEREPPRASAPASEVLATSVLSTGAGGGSPNVTNEAVPPPESVAPAPSREREDATTAGPVGASSAIAPPGDATAPPNTMTAPRPNGVTAPVPGVAPGSFASGAAPTVKAPEAPVLRDDPKKRPAAGSPPRDPDNGAGLTNFGGRR